MGGLLFVSYSGAFGGAERVLLDCAAAAPGVQCVACPEGPLAEQARAAGVPVLSIPRRRANLRAGARDQLLAPLRLVAHALELRALTERLDPDALVVWGMRSAIAGLAVPRQVAQVFAHNDMLPGAAVAAVIRAAAARARLVIVPSQAVASDLDPRGRLGRRLKIINPGVALERFAAEHAPAVPPEVLVLGALVAWKRPDLALEAVALARREIPELRLRLVGAPLQAEDSVVDGLRRRAARPDLDGAVEIVGQRPRPEVDLARASCLLHCAPREPFGLVVAEALAAGCPAIVPACGGPTEIVDRSCALLYRPGDAAGAARAIVELLADPERAARMSDAARRRARSHLDRTRSESGFVGELAPLVRTRVASACTPEQLTLVTVTHNSALVLDALLRSVERHLAGARVVVVDNASRDDSLKVARSRPWVATIALDHNVGFARACNRGLREVGTPVTALVNPDVELVDDSLLQLAREALRGDRPARLLAPLVLSDDGSRQDTVHPVPASAPDVVRSLLTPALFPPRTLASLWPWRASDPRRVGWAVGCALVARTDTLVTLGPFDESIFLYAEDLELGLRAAQRSIETWFWPRGRVLHHQAHSSAPAFGGEPFTRLARARHEVVARRLGRRRATLDEVVQGVTFGSRIAIKRALRRPATREGDQLRALIGLRGAGRRPGA